MYLITGAGGHLGHDLALVLGGQDRAFLACTRAELDICDLEAIEKVLARTQARVLFNCAAYTQVDKAESEGERAWQVNALAPGLLARACQAYDCRLIHISTDYVFDGQASTPYPEDAPTRPLGSYGQSKRAGEVAVLQSSDAHLVVRTAWLYGVGGSNFVRTILRLAKERERLRVVADQVGSPTWSYDLAVALVGLADGNAAGGIYHLTNSGVTSWYDFAVAIVEEAEALGEKDFRLGDIEPIATADYPTAAARPAYSVLATARAAQLLGAPLPQWRKGLRRMLAQLYEQEEKR